MSKPIFEDGEWGFHWHQIRTLWLYYF